MCTNLLYMRQKSNSTKKIIAKLLNVSVYTYTGYETDRLIIPNEVLVMLAKIYNIPISDLFCKEEAISDTTINKLHLLSSISEAQRVQQLTENLTGNSHTNISYREIKKIKNSIINNINYKEVSN